MTADQIVETLAEDYVDNLYLGPTLEKLEVEVCKLSNEINTNELKELINQLTGETIKEVSNGFDRGFREGIKFLSSFFENGSFEKLTFKEL